MMEKEDLERFVLAQETTFGNALSEIMEGKKKTHWMWFIFPQIAGLGSSPMAQRYAIKNRAEAETYLRHPLLGPRLVRLSGELIKLQTADPLSVMGSPDDMKLNSCMTLFESLPNPDPVFAAVNEKFFGGRRDEKTIRILNQGK